MIRQNITQQELQVECKKLAKQIWGLDFTIPVKISGRMTKTLGLFRYYPATHTPKCITISKHLIQNYSNKTIHSVVLHELTHWALFVQHKPCKDKDLTFIKEAKRIGASLTGTIPQAGLLHTFICSKCKQCVGEYRERTKNTMMKKIHVYISTCCGSSISYNGTKYIKDTYLVK